MTGDCHVRIRGSRGLRCPRPPDHAGRPNKRSCFPAVSGLRSPTAWLGRYFTCGTRVWSSVQHGDAISSPTAVSRCSWTTRTALTVSYTHLRAHETVLDLVCRLLL